MTVVEIQAVTSEGDGVAHLPDGRVIFVSETFPGDRVELDAFEWRAGVLRATPKRRLENSSHRVTSVCSTPSCGGCPWKGIDAGAQLSYKCARLRETLRRVGGIDVGDDLLPPIASEFSWRYRHRVRLHAEWRADRWRLGFFERGSHNLVAIERCPVLWSELEEACSGLRRRLVGLPESLGLTEVEVAYSRLDRKATGVVTVKGDIAPLGDFLQDHSPLTGVELRGATTRLRFGRLALRYDHRRAENYSLFFEAGVFTQAHPVMNDHLVTLVLDAVEGSKNTRILELHAGIGNFTLPLAASGAQVVATEQLHRAVILNRQNLARAGLNAEVHVLADHRAVERFSECDVVVLDPPRAGAKRVARRLVSTAARRVVYVSCDAATLARDLGVLSAGGFRVISIQPLDLFPQTPHLEVVAVLERGRP